MRTPLRSLLTFFGLMLMGGMLFVGWSEISERSLFSFQYSPPSPEIELLAQETTMTPKAQQLFYRQNPKIEPKEQFQNQCRKPGQAPEKSIILGCYTSNGYQGSIIIQSITDSRLQGMMEVVAAHEMLHAAYHQLNSKQRDQLIPKLEQAAQRVNDPQLLSILEAYQARDQDVYVNELHSHLGTELEDLGDPGLEAHYRQYFNNRRQVVAFAKSSRRTLTALEAQADQLKPELDSLESTLKSEESYIAQLAENLESQAAQLDQQQADLNQLQRQAEESLSWGDSSLVNEFERAQDRFNEAVRNYNNQVQAHRDRVAQFNEQIDIYQQKVANYNELAQTRRSILSSLEVNGAQTSPPELEGS